MASSNSPCAACKFLRRKCTQECVFAPYFPPDQPVKFANVHKVFGASNVAKILNELNANQREDAVNSLAYEADARLRDPVYGCVGLISVLQSRLKQLQTDLLIAKQELFTFVGPSGIMQGLNPAFMQQYQNLQLQQQQQLAIASGMHPNMQLQPRLTLQGPGNPRDAHHQQQLYEAHQRQLIEAAREQEMLRNLEYQRRVHQHQHQQQQLQQQLQQQHQQQSADLMRNNMNTGFDAAGPSGQSAHVNLNSSGYTQLTGPGNISPSLALGGSYDNNMYQIQHRQQQQQHHRQSEHEQHHQLQHLRQPEHEQHNQVQQQRQPEHEHHHQPQHLRQPEHEQHNQVQQQRQPEHEHHHQPQHLRQPEHEQHNQVQQQRQPEHEQHHPPQHLRQPEHEQHQQQQQHQQPEHEQHHQLQQPHHQQQPPQEHNQQLQLLPQHLMLQQQQPQQPPQLPPQQPPAQPHQGDGSEEGRSGGGGGSVPSC